MKIVNYLFKSLTMFKLIILLLYFIIINKSLSNCLISCQSNPCFIDSGLGYNVYSFYITSLENCQVPFLFNENPTPLEITSFINNENIELIDRFNYTLKTYSINIKNNTDFCVQSPTFGLNSFKCMGNGLNNFTNINLLQNYPLNNFFDTTSNSNISLPINIETQINNSFNSQFFINQQLFQKIESNKNGIINTFGVFYSIPNGGSSFAQYSIDNVATGFIEFFGIQYINYNELTNNNFLCGYYQVDLNMFPSNYITDCSTCNMYNNQYNISNIPLTNPQSICSQLNYNLTANFPSPAMWSMTLNVIYGNTPTFSFSSFQGNVFQITFLMYPYLGSCLIKPINPVGGNFLQCNLITNLDFDLPLSPNYYRGIVDIYNDFNYVLYNCSTLTLDCGFTNVVYSIQPSLLVKKQQNVFINSQPQVFNLIGWFQLFYVWTTSLFWVLTTWHLIFCLIMLIMVLTIFYYCCVKGKFLSKKDYLQGQGDVLYEL
jgi:hypothetical protein